MTPANPIDWAKVEKERELWRRLSKAQDKLLMAYRTGSQRGVGGALDEIQRCRRQLEKLEKADG